MDWWTFITNMFTRVPVERFLFPPRDSARELEKFAAGVEAPVAKKETAAQEKTAITPQRPQGVALGGSSAVITREGVDAERLAWQDGIIRGELWLLEGHLKNKCIGCGGDLECCFKHCQNIVAAARETQSMTTAPLYQETVSLIEGVQPFVLPADVKAEKYVTYYPPMAVKVSKVRTQFDKRVMLQAHPVITLDEAKKLASEEAAKEVEKRWRSQEPK